jgi:hypothetical protein
MGCGPSRANNKHSGLGLSTDCSGSLCHTYIHDISDVEVLSISSDRIMAETILMDIDTLTDYNKLIIQYTGLQANNTDKTTYGMMYSNILKFINDNGANITNDQVSLLVSATNTMTTSGSVTSGTTTVSPIALDFAMVQMVDIMSISGSTAIPSNVKTWYNNYVEMLYQLVVNTPAYTPNDINLKVNSWITANPPPDTGFNRFTNYKSKMTTKKSKQISSFTDYSGILSQTKLLPKNYHNF